MPTVSVAVAMMVPTVPANQPGLEISRSPCAHRRCRSTAACRGLQSSVRTSTICVDSRLEARDLGLAGLELVRGNVVALLGRRAEGVGERVSLGRREVGRGQRTGNSVRVEHRSDSPTTGRLNLFCGRRCYQAILMPSGAADYPAGHLFGGNVWKKTSP